MSKEKLKKDCAITTNILIIGGENILTKFYTKKKYKRIFHRSVEVLPCKTLQTFLIYLEDDEQDG